MNTLWRIIFGLASAFILVVPAKADPARGQVLFAACAACHDVGSISSRTGPSLKGIIGRPAGALSDFRYSRAMSQSGIIWTDDNISKFINYPQGFIRGNRMPFSGILSSDDRNDIVDYLKNISR